MLFIWQEVKKRPIKEKKYGLSHAHTDTYIHTL